MDATETAAFSFNVKAYLLEMIKMADDKAKAAFAVSAGLLAYLVNTKPRFVIEFAAPIDWLAFGWSGAVVLLLSSSVFSFSVLLPRMRTTSRGLIFFSSIAEHQAPEDYADDLGSRSAEDVARLNAMHNFDLSVVAVKKYQALGRAMRAGVLGFCVLLIFWLSNG